MPASILSPADVVNLSLRRIGYKLRVGSLYDGSMAAKQALDLYAQTRDAVLRGFNWGFAEIIAAAVLSGGVAPFPWTVEYTYPADCLRLRNLFNATYSGDPNNPRSNLYTIADAAAGKVIWAKAASATLVYTGQITDPAKWEPLFIETLAVTLSKRLAPVLTTIEAVKIGAEDEKIVAPLAEGTIG